MIVLVTGGLFSPQKVVEKLCIHDDSREDVLTTFCFLKIKLSKFYVVCFHTDVY